MCRQIETNRYGAKKGIDRKGTEEGNRKKGSKGQGLALTSVKE